MTRLPNTPLHDNPLIAHGRRGITRGVVIHSIEGAAEGAEAWFRNRQARGVGAHLIVGQGVIQTTDLDNVCWHAVGANSEWIGFEHEGFASYSKARWLLTSNRKLLRLSANRVGWICVHYKLGLPTKGLNVKAHADFPAGGHHDPGPGWPWDLYVWLARRAYKRIQKTGRW